MIPTPLKIIPNSGPHLQLIFQNNQQMSLIVWITLITHRDRYENLLKQNKRNKKIVLEKIKLKSADEELLDLYYLADIHLIPLQFPKWTNLTFSIDCGKYFFKWKTYLWILVAQQRL